MAKLKEIHKQFNHFDVKITTLKHDVGGRRLKGVSSANQWPPKYAGIRRYSVLITSKTYHIDEPAEEKGCFVE